MSIINEKIIKELKKRRIPFSELSEKLNYSYQGIYKALHSKETIRFELLLDISKILNLPITYWFDDELKQINIASNNQINGNNNKIEVQLNALNAEIERLRREIEFLKKEIQLKDELIEILKTHNKTLINKK